MSEDVWVAGELVPMTADEARRYRLAMSRAVRLQQERALAVLASRLKA